LSPCRPHGVPTARPEAAQPGSIRSVTQGRTEHRNPRCYARDLGGCSTAISREHYISKSVMLAAGGKPQIAGLKFQEPETLQSFGVGGMTAKILCRRHNHDLSPLDAEAAHFFSTLRDFDRDLRDATQSVTAEATTDGAKLERWMLKLLAGLVYGKLINSAALRRETQWLKILFGMEDWPPGWGFHFVASDETFYAFAGLEVSIRAVGDEVWAAEIGVAGLKFYLCLGTPEGNPSLRRRPSEIIMKRADRDAYKRLTFQWPSGPETGLVELTRTGQYDGARPQDRGYREK
jgi:hypothetical protein